MRGAFPSLCVLFVDQNNNARSRGTWVFHFLSNPLNTDHETRLQINLFRHSILHSIPLSSIRSSIIPRSRWSSKSLSLLSLIYRPSVLCVCPIFQLLEAFLVLCQRYAVLPFFFLPPRSKGDVLGCIGYRTRRSIKQSCRRKVKTFIQANAADRTIQ